MLPARFHLILSFILSSNSDTISAILLSYFYSLNAIIDSSKNQGNMQSSGGDNQKLPNYPGRPFSPFAAAPPRSTTPFASSGPIVGPDMSSYQPQIPTPGPGVAPPSHNLMGYGPSRQVATPGSVVSGVQSPPHHIRSPSSPTQVSTFPSGPYPRMPPSFAPNSQFQSPPFAPNAQVQIPPPVGTRPPPPFQPTFPLPGPPQANVPAYLSIAPRVSSPLQPIDPSFPILRAGSQPHLPPNMAPPAPVAFPPNVDPRGVQFGSGPPSSGALQSLYEEFQSMSIGSTAGSIEGGIDLNSLPRPLDISTESTTVIDTHPLNCHPRYLRLTTHAIPNSQSLLSRWHLPIGAVVHPLAESPDGVGYTMSVIYYLFSCALVFHQ